MVRPTSGKGHCPRSSKRSFLVFEEGDYDEDEGWWVMDEETFEDGFLSAFTDTFCIPKDEDATDWESAHVASRFLSKGKGRRLQRKKRGKISPRRGNGRAHVAEKDWTHYDGDYCDSSYYDYGEFREES